MDDVSPHAVIAALATMIARSAATGAWHGLRPRVARALGRGSTAEEESVRRRLGEEQGRGQGEVRERWRALLEEHVERQPEALEELAAIVATSADEPAPGPVVTQRARARGRSRVQQAGGDITTG